MRRLASIVKSALGPKASVGVISCVAGLLAWNSGYMPVLSRQSEPALAWVEDTFEDFRDGQFSGSGQNLYATKRGAIKTVHRFDLNSDGYIDLTYNSSHDFITAPEPTFRPRESRCR
jgi:hypothetical protein